MSLSSISVRICDSPVAERRAITTSHLRARKLSDLTGGGALRANPDRHGSLAQSVMRMRAWSDLETLFPPLPRTKVPAGGGHVCRGMCTASFGSRPRCSENTTRPPNPATPSTNPARTWPSIGIPPTGCSTLGRRDFMRVPWPAARMTTWKGTTAPYLSWADRPPFRPGVFAEHSVRMRAGRHVHHRRAYQYSALRRDAAGHPRHGFFRIEKVIEVGKDPLEHLSKRAAPAGSVRYLFHDRQRQESPISFWVAVDRTDGRPITLTYGKQYESESAESAERA